MMSYTCHIFLVMSPWHFSVRFLIYENSDLLYFDSTRRRVSPGIFYLFCSISCDGTDLNFTPWMYFIIVPSPPSPLTRFLLQRTLGLLTTATVLPLTQKLCLYCISYFSYAVTLLCSLH